MHQPSTILKHYLELHPGSKAQHRSTKCSPQAPAQVTSALQLKYDPHFSLSQALPNQLTNRQGSPSNTFFDVPLEEAPSSPTPDDTNYDWVEAQHAEQPLHEEEGILIDEDEIEAPEYIFHNDDDDDDNSLPEYNSPIEDMPVPMVDMDAQAADLRDALVQGRLAEVQESVDDNVWMVWLLGDEREELFLDVYRGEWI